MSGQARFGKLFEKGVWERELQETALGVRGSCTEYGTRHAQVSARSPAHSQDPTYLRGIKTQSGLRNSDGDEEPPDRRVSTSLKEGMDAADGVWGVRGGGVQTLKRRVGPEASLCCFERAMRELRPFGVRYVGLGSCLVVGCCACGMLLRHTVA